MKVENNEQVFERQQKKMTNKEILKIASWLVTDDLCEERTEYCDKSCIECQYEVQKRLRQMAQEMEDD